MDDTAGVPKCLQLGSFCLFRPPPLSTRLEDFSWLGEWKEGLPPFLFDQLPPQEGEGGKRRGGRNLKGPGGTSSFLP